MEEKRAYAKELDIRKASAQDKIIGLAGNPNVGKSTVFNQLTGMNQHTGNWPGKTVANARGQYTYGGVNYILVDMPGTYSILASSAEEEVARNFICFGGADVTCVVADATCLERNLNLVLQILEITGNVVLCVNLIDEAKKKNIRIDLEKLSQTLGVPVVGTSARTGKGLSRLCEAIQEACKERRACRRIDYGEVIESAAAQISKRLDRLPCGGLSTRWLSLRILEEDTAFIRSLSDHLGAELSEDTEYQKALLAARAILVSGGIGQETLRDCYVSKIVRESEAIYHACVQTKPDYNARDRRLDRILTAKTTGIPIMLALLFVIFWITISGANYPSELLFSIFSWLEARLWELFAGAPPFISSLLIGGMYRVLSWVVSVMLPPMAIFFPLFTLLEDLGYLPRIAFNMDKFFKKAHAHGKQALTMCMGFGCNACGVTGCRIIDSPRERLIAILTNNFVPCNGRFPTMISIITMFFAGTVASGFCQSLVSTLILTGVIVLGVVVTLLVSRLLSMTVLGGMPSSFALELPPYRVPQVGKVIVRSILDRTLFVLGRAVMVAAPAGLLIWLLANIYIGDMSILSHCAAFLDPIAWWFGLDGVILMAFVLGLPANEIVMPIVIMTYLATGTLTEMDSVQELHALLVNNGWTWLTAVCTMLFSLMHFPCATTCLTVRKETGSWKWTAAAFILPTVTGLLACFLVAGVARLLGLA